MAHRFEFRLAAACAAAAGLLAGCPAGGPGSAPEASTDVDRARAADVRADPLLAGGGVEVGDRLYGRPGWHRTRGSRDVVVPLSDPRDDAARAAHVHRAVRTILDRARAAGWQVFHVDCGPGAAPMWTVHGYRPESGYLADLQITARAEIGGVTEDGAVGIQLLAPYHLDPPSLVGDPPPAPLAAGATCLDRPDPPRAEQSAGSDVAVKPDANT